MYLRLNRLDDALVDYDEALRRNQKLASSLYGRGLAKLKRGDAARLTSQRQRLFEPTTRPNKP